MDLYEKFLYVMSVSYSVCYECLIDVLRTSRKQTIDVDIDMFPFDNAFPDPNPFLSTKN